MNWGNWSHYHSNIPLREAPKEPYFVETRNEVPLRSEFKPAVKVLSRKPTPSIASQKDPSNGLEKLTLDDEDEEDEEDLIKKPLTMEERQLKAQKEREEKQKKYEEVRQRLFGDADAASVSVPSSGNMTPPIRSGADSRNRRRSKGGRDSRPPSSADNQPRQLYDPNYTIKPESVYIQKREAHASESDRSTPVEEQLIRAPKGPDGTGRGGHGFANRRRGAP